MANIFKKIGKFFGFSPERDITYTGQVPPRTMRQTPLGKTLQDVLTERIQGRGVGFEPEFVERTTEPVIAQREARFAEYERPELESYLASRGIGRSTLGADLLSRQMAAKERDISDILGQRYLQQELQKRGEISQALGMAPGLVGQELGLQAQRAAFDYQDYLNQLATARLRQQAEAQAAQRMALAGLGAGIGAGIGGFEGAVGGAAGIDPLSLLLLQRNYGYSGGE